MNQRLSPRGIKGRERFDYAARETDSRQTLPKQGHMEVDGLNITIEKPSTNGIRYFDHEVAHK